MKPLVTIVVPMYNVEKFIEKCGTSLFEQTYANIEYIFVNDCTPDNSVEILRNIIINYPERESQVKIIHHEVNRGIAATRNTGISHANGVYLLQVDGDDFIHEKTIELMVGEAIEKNADMVLCNYTLNFRNKNIEVKHGFLNKEQYLKDTLSAKIPPSIWNKLIRLDLYKKNNLLFQEGVNYGEDYMVVPKIIYFSKKIVAVDSSLYNYIRWNLSSYTATIKSTHIFNLKQVILNLKYFFSTIPYYSDSLHAGISQKKHDLLLGVSSYKDFNFVESEFHSFFHKSGDTYKNQKLIAYLKFLSFLFYKKIRNIYVFLKGF